MKITVCNYFLRVFVIAFICLTHVLVANVLAADTESMGKFRFDEFVLSPRLSVTEPSQGGFALKESWLGFRWEKEDDVFGVIKLGTQDTVQPAVWFSPLANSSNLGLVEAWVEGDSEYMNIRAGLLPIAQSFESLSQEWAWYLPASEVRKNNWLIARDYGVQFSVATRPFFTTLTVHNGESGNNTDNKMWVSALWKVQTSRGFGFLMSGVVGHTTPLSTGSSVATAQGFVFDKDKEAKIRYGIYSLFYQKERNLFLIEVGRGDVLQSDIKLPYAWSRVDVAWNPSGDVSLLARYEQTQADLNLSSTVVKSWGGGVSYSGKERISSITLFGMHHEEAARTHNDEALLLFRLNSNL